MPITPMTTGPGGPAAMMICERAKRVQNYFQSNECQYLSHIVATDKGHKGHLGPYAKRSWILGILGWKPSNETINSYVSFKTFSVGFRFRKGSGNPIQDRSRNPGENRLLVRIFLTPPSLGTAILAFPKAHQESMR